MLSMIVLGIFVFLMIIFMVILIMETISSAAEAEKRRRKNIPAKSTEKSERTKSRYARDDYFEKFDRRV
jgi:uncharacterized membrane protein